MAGNAALALTLIALLIALAVRVAAGDVPPSIATEEAGQAVLQIAYTWTLRIGLVLFLLLMAATYLRLWFHYDPEPLRLSRILVEPLDAAALASALVAPPASMPNAASTPDSMPAPDAAPAAAPEKKGKGKEKAADAMEVDSAAKPSLATLLADVTAAHARGAVSTVVYAALVALKPPPEKAEKAEGDEKEKKKGEEKPDETDFEILENPARVLRGQERAISLLPDARYVPVTPGRVSGIIVLKDQTPDEEEELLVATASAPPGGANDDEEEPGPPAPFEFTEE